MRFLRTELEGVIVIEPDVHRDERGFFLEWFRQDKYRAGGVDAAFVQDNHSCSRRGVLRGLHLQHRRPQAKLVRVIAGEIFDVVADVRRDSPTFRRFVSANLSAENFRQVFIPAGYAHGLLVLSDEAQVEYKVTDFYDPGGELTILWNDPELAIPWPVLDPILSDKDRAGRRLAEIQDFLGRDPRAAQ
jgi:dTDP-4-dehydrorhamnose 3,5-epimerase